MAIENAIQNIAFKAYFMTFLLFGTKSIRTQVSSYLSQFVLILVNSYSVFGQFVLIFLNLVNSFSLWSIRTQFSVNSFSYQTVLYFR